MIWKDPGFKDAYRAKLRNAHSDAEVEVRAQAQAFRAEAARAGGSSAEQFVQRAGAAAAATLSGYVKSALDAFEGVISSLEAELEEADLDALQGSLEQEIAHRTKALPATLRDFTRPASQPALLRTILQQAPAKARQLLAERVATSRGRIHTAILSRELPDRAILIGHDAGDSAVADALKLTIMQAVGADAPLYTSPELESVRTGRHGFERVLGQLKKNRMMLTIVTPGSSANPWLWWLVGVAAGTGKPVFVLRANGLGADTTFPIDQAQDVDLANRDQVLRLLHAVQGELRRRPKDPSEVELEELLESSRSGPSS